MLLVLSPLAPESAKATIQEPAARSISKHAGKRRVAKELVQQVSWQASQWVSRSMWTLAHLLYVNDQPECCRIAAIADAPSRDLFPNLCGSVTLVSGQIGRY